MENNNYYGFLGQKNIRSVIKAKEELNREITYNCLEINGNDEDITSSNAQYIYILAENGYIPKEVKSEKGKSSYVMKRGKKSFKILRTLADYAEYLIANDIFDSDDEEETEDINAASDEEDIKENNSGENAGDSEEDNSSEDEDDYVGEKDNNEEGETVLSYENEAARDERKRDNAAKISAKNDFEVQLMEAASKYPNNEKVTLLKKVFEAEAGVFDEHAKELLVLIDNFDEPEYRTALINRLWNGNTVSRKVFECITGLELPITNTDIGRYFSALTKADFKGMSEYKLVTAADHAKEKTFYIKSKKGFEKVQGYEYSTNGLELFIRYTQTEVVISDVKTGVMLAKGTNETEAKDNLQKSIDKHGIEKVTKLLAGNEINPVYTKKSEN